MKKIMQNIEVKVGTVYDETKSKNTTSTEEPSFDPRKLLLNPVIPHNQISPLSARTPNADDIPGNIVTIPLAQNNINYDLKPNNRYY